MVRNIGRQLKELRLEKGLSQKEVAEELSITRQSISKWELDKGTPDLDMLRKLAVLYDFSIDELFLLREEKLMNLPIVTVQEMIDLSLEHLTEKHDEKQAAFLEANFFQPLAQRLVPERILWTGVIPMKTVGMGTNLTAETPITNELTERYRQLFEGDNGVYLFLTTQGFYRTTAVTWLEQKDLQRIPLTEIVWLVAGPYYKTKSAQRGQGLFYGTVTGGYDLLPLSLKEVTTLTSVLKYLDPQSRHFRVVTKTPLVEVATLWRKKKRLPEE